MNRDRCRHKLHASNIGQWKSLPVGSSSPEIIICTYIHTYDHAMQPNGIWDRDMT
jgi:hypothetical protein